MDRFVTPFVTRLVTLWCRVGAILYAENTGASKREGEESMYGGNASMLSQMQLQARASRPGEGDQPIRLALLRYRDARRQAWLGRAWSALTGRSHRLLHLSDVLASCTLRGSHHAGTRSVPISQIRGSEGRCDDFDADFQPLRSHNRGRWVSVATARARGVTLPVVELVQVGDAYFVRDGHHRISVAKAWGQESIDAEVTVWDVVGPLPWEWLVRTGEFAVQPA